MPGEPLHSASEILVLKRNTQGKDYPVGDLHGSYDEIFAALKFIKFNEHDRLLSVGDIIDRGPKSLELTEYLMSLKNFFMVRGNHEDLFILFARLKLNPNRTSTEEAEFKRIREIYFYQFQGQWADQISLEKLKILCDYFESCPHAIYVEGNPEAKSDADKPFMLGHASLPLNDKAFQQRLNESKEPQLYPKEIRYITESREKNIAMRLENSIAIETGIRSKDSIRSYVGHSVLGGPIPERNEMNLDVGCYFTRTILLMSVQENKTILLPCNANNLNLLLVMEVQASSNYFLRKKMLPDTELVELVHNINHEIADYGSREAPLNNELRILLFAASFNIYKESGSLAEKKDDLEFFKTLGMHCLDFTNELYPIQKEGFILTDLHHRLRDIFIDHYNKQFSLLELYLSLYDAIKKEIDSLKEKSAFTSFSPNEALIEKLNKIIDSPNKKHIYEMISKQLGREEPKKSGPGSLS